MKWALFHWFLSFPKSNLSAFSFGIWKQVDELLHIHSSAGDGVPRDNTWETHTHIHFQDNHGVMVTIKPEHRVEDILTLACKVIDFAAEIVFWRKVIVNTALLRLLNMCGVYDLTFHTGEPTIYYLTYLLISILIHPVEVWGVQS